MNAQAAHEAATLLWRHRVAGTALDALPPALRPADAPQGHAIQAELPRVAGQPVVGWKIAATSAAGQAHIRVPGPLPGRILSGAVFDAASPPPLAGNRMRVAEPEFAFRFGRDLPPRPGGYDRTEVLAAVESLHPAFELPNSRFADFAAAGAPQLIADDACCGVFTLGSAAPQAWRTLDLRAHRVHGEVSGADGRLRLQRDGDGSAVLGDPCEALLWLVHELGSLGIALERGQFVSTGTCMTPLAIEPGDRVQADFGVLGSVAVDLGGC